MNSYSYADSNPVNLVDPQGLQSQGDPITVQAADSKGQLVGFATAGGANWSRNTEGYFERVDPFAEGSGEVIEVTPVTSGWLGNVEARLLGNVFFQFEGKHFIWFSEENSPTEVNEITYFSRMHVPYGALILIPSLWLLYWTFRGAPDPELPAS